MRKGESLRANPRVILESAGLVIEIDHRCGGNGSYQSNDYRQANCPDAAGTIETAKFSGHTDFEL